MMNNKLLVIPLLLGCCLLVSCSKNRMERILVGTHEYISVKQFGAKGNGSSDDRLAIQKAFDSGEDIYFPDGRYVLKSKTITTGMLVVRENKHPSKLFFEDSAILEVSPDQPKDYIKPAVIVIFADKGNVDPIFIEGLTIEGNRDKHNIENPGLVAYERKGMAVRKLVLRNITVRNTGGGGIHTQARYNDFKNIRTENCGSHGIGIINTTNKGVVNEFYLDQHTSINDDAYSIDFSGFKDPSNVGHAYPGYEWKGEAKNIISKGSLYGIKTAGYWDLKLDSVLIEDSKNNGFFINVAAPGAFLELSNITIKNAKANGLALNGKTNFKGTNINLENCSVGIKIKDTDVDIDGLKIDGKNNSKATIRMGNSNVSLKNFEIKNTSTTDEYTIWANGPNVKLENGKIDGNGKLASMIIHKNAGEVLIKNVEFEGEKGSSKKAILNIQDKGNTIVKNCSFATIPEKAIDDRSKSLRIKN